MNLTHDTRKRILAAFKRSAVIDASRIQIDVAGSTVTIRGEVRSLAEKEDAEYAARSTPGVETLNNLLVINEADCDDDDSELKEYANHPD